MGSTVYRSVIKCGVDGGCGQTMCVEVGVGVQGVRRHMDIEVRLG